MAGQLRLGDRGGSQGQGWDGKAEEAKQHCLVDLWDLHTFLPAQKHTLAMIRYLSVVNSVHGKEGSWPWGL